VNRAKELAKQLEEERKAANGPAKDKELVA
jgi:hypothetical protein